MSARGADGRFLAGIDIQVNDRTAAPLRSITVRMGGLEKASRKASAAFDMGNLDAISRAATAAIEKPLRKFASFEEQMDSVTASTFDLTKAMDAGQVKVMDNAVAELSATARKLGADTKYSATEAAAGMDILAKNFAGDDLKKTQDIIDAMPGVLDTAAATKESIASVADIQTKTMNQFGLQADAMGRIGDVFVKTANTSSTGLLDLGEALTYTGTTAHDANVDLETTLAMLGALGNAGKTGSVAGTGLASVLGNMQSGMKKQKNALAALGINIKDKRGNLRPIVELLAEIDKAADKKFGGKGKGGVKRDRWLQGLVGMGSDKEALAILTKQAGSGELQKLVEANRAAAGTAHLVAEAMSDNTAGAARELDGALEELQLTIGEQVTPQLTELLGGAKEVTLQVAAWVKENPELTKGLAALAVGLGIAAAATRVLTVVMMTNPIIAIATGIAVAAYLIYEHWDGVTAFFEKHWAAVTAVFAPFMILLGPIIGAAKLIMDNWQPLSDFFTGLWATVTAGFNAAMEGILAGIGWVGDKIKEFRALTMGPEEAAAQAAEAEANAKTVLGGDDFVAGGVTSRGGVGDWGMGKQGSGDAIQTQAAANNAAYAADQLARMSGTGAYEQYGPAAPTAEESAALGQRQAIDGAVVMDKMDHMLAAQGPALMKGGGWDPNTGKFKGELKITIDSNGNVQKSEMTSSGDPGFETRVNRGGQAAA